MPYSSLLNCFKHDVLQILGTPTELHEWLESSEERSPLASSLTRVKRGEKPISSLETWLC